MENYFRNNLRDLPFDQHQRYTALAEAADLFRKESPLRVLDVGGYLEGGGQNGFIPAEVFLPNDRITVLDVKFNGPGHYIVGSGLSLPFRTGSFDLVSAMDTLEHIPAHRRALFVTELMRVSSNGVVIAGPVKTPLTELSEQILDQVIQKLFHAQHPALVEHLMFGLPEADEIRSWLTSGGMRYIEFPDGFLLNWLFMMIIKHHLMTLEDPVPLQHEFDRFYNTMAGAEDRREPAYRHVFVATKQDSVVALELDHFYTGRPQSVQNLQYPLEMTNLLLARESLKLSRQIQDLFLTQPTWFELHELAQDRFNLIQEKDHVISQQFDMITGKDAIITDLDGGIRSKDEQIKTLNQEISCLKSEIASLQQALTNSVSSLEQIKHAHHELVLFRDKTIQSLPYRLYHSLRRKQS